MGMEFLAGIVRTFTGVTFASVCSGIEAASVAFLPLGWKCAFLAEIEPFPCAVLKHHYPETPNYGDITNYQEWPRHTIDVLIGGTPCQSFSIAGQRMGIQDPRGNLALVFLGIVAKYHPRFVIWENVPGVHSSWTDEKVRAPTEDEIRELRDRGLDPSEYEYFEQSNDFDSFLSGLEGLQYGITTAVLDAQYFNLAQRRARVFVVGCAGGQWQRAAAILADAESMSWNNPPSRTERKDIAPTLSSRSKGGGGLGTDAELDGGLIAATLGTGGHSGVNVDSPLVAVAGALQERDSKGVDSKTKPGHLIPTENASALNCGTDPNQNVVVSGALRSQHNPAANSEHIVFQPRFTRDKASGHPSDICPALTSQAKQGDGHPCVFQPRIARNGRGGAGDNQAQALTVNNDHGDSQQHVASMSGVRRLTVIECSRLQGFPDNYLSIPWRGKPAEECPDGPRYRALGNSMAIPVIGWIGKQIEAVDKIK